MDNYVFQNADGEYYGFMAWDEESAWQQFNRFMNKEFGETISRRLWDCIRQDSERDYQREAGLIA